MLGESSWAVNILSLMHCRRVKDGLAAGTTTVTGDSWPMFLYADSEYDENNPWKGLLRGQLLVKV